MLAVAVYGGLLAAVYAAALAVSEIAIVYTP